MTQDQLRDIFDFYANFGRTQVQTFQNSMDSFMFMKFCKEMRPAVMRENPGIEFQNVGKELGKKWRALSEAEKKKY
jgi:hypothetical protein